MDDIILIDKVIGGYYSHEPLQKPPKSRSTPQNLGNFPYDCKSQHLLWIQASRIYTNIIGSFRCRSLKAQISIFPPGKYHRPARFERGCQFWDPLPMVYAVWPSVSSSGTVILSFL